MQGIPKITERISESVEIATVSDGDTCELRIVLFGIEKSTRKHSFKNVVFKKCIFSQRSISSLTFHSCEFNECMFIGAAIVDCEFHNSKLINCCFFKAKISGTYIDPSSFVFRS